MFAVLSWVFVRLIPDRDKATEREQQAARAQLSDVIEKKDAAIALILKSKDEAVDKALARQSEVVGQVLGHCTDEMRQCRETQERHHVELMDSLRGNYASTREAVHAIRNLANQIAMRSQLADAVQSLEAPAYTKSLDGTVMSWNMAAERLLGWKQGEIVGHSLFGTIIPPSKRPDEEKILAKIAAGETVDEYVTERLCKDGTALKVFLLVSPIRDQSGKVVGASTIIGLPHG